MRNQFRYARRLVVATFLLAIAIFAQSDTAQISGTVKDASGSAVPNAAVNIQNEATGLERRVSTNESGYYVVTSLPPGFYTISVEATGFKRFQKTQNKLDPNIASRVDANLEVGAVTETIDVVATAVNIQSETATVGKLVEASQISNMSLNGRNPVFLAQLKPGVRGGSLAGFNFGLTTGSLNINGSRTQDNLITFDGAPAVRTRSNGTSIGVADVDSVQEMQILTANYNAEYGRAAGGQIRIVTKSGTRAFHGDFYEFFRNSAMNANEWSRNLSNNPEISGNPAPFRYNQFGYNVNGPVYIPGVWNKDRNKVFFLWGQEWVRFRRDATNIRTVPTPAMRNGDFSELLDPSNQFTGRMSVVSDPETGQPFPNNVIPQNRLSPNGIALLRSAPPPTPGFRQGSANHIATAGQPTNQRKDTISLDFNPADEHQFRFRHQNYSYYDLNPFDGGSDRTPREFERPNRTASLNYIWTLGPTVVNEFLATASVDRVYIRVVRSDRLNRSTYGINYPYIFPDRKEIPEKIPTVDMPVFWIANGGPYPAQSTGPIYNLSDNITKISGSHTLKFGFLFERSGQNDFDQINVSGVPGGTNNQNGRFVFSDARTGAPSTGLAIGNAAMGLFDTYAEIGVRSFTPYRGHMFEWFVQDSWRATPKLKVELGLRHSVIQPYYSLWRNMVVFDPNFYDPSIAVSQDLRTGNITGGDLRSRYNGLVIPGDGWAEAASGRVPIADSGEFNFLFRGVPKHYSSIQKKDFQPRVGLAYSFNDRTVLRAGAGKFVTRLGVSDSVFLGGNPPLQPMVSISNGSVDNPAGGGGTGTAFPLNITTQDPVFPNPQSWAWNVTFQREVGADTTVEAGYVGRRGLHGQRERNMNQLQPGTIQANPGVNPDYLRPYKGFGPIRITNNDANSMYNSFQLDVTRRFTRGFSFNLGYTYSKCEDNGSAQRDIIPNAFDASMLWGPCTYDAPHILVTNFIYELPIFKNRDTIAGKVLGGWQLTGVTQLQSGTTATVATNDDFAGVGPGSGNQIWNRSGEIAYEHKFSEGAGRDQNFWFVPTANGQPVFSRPAAGTFTTERSRGIIRHPGFQNWNLAVFKNFYPAERHRVQFRAEAFNWINHPNWDDVEINPTSGNFGRVTAKTSERQLQLSLRYSF